jgi:two-component system cell cycle sensor histidine kinase/response regulator CckA
MRPTTFFLLGAAFAGLGLLVAYRRPTDPVTRSFGLFSLGLAGWVCGIGGLHTGGHATAWGRLTFASASVIPAAFLSFAWAYPRPSPWPALGIRRAVWGAALGFVLLSLATRLVLYDGGGVSPLGLRREPGPLYPLFATYFLAAALLGLGVFVVKWRRARGPERVQLGHLGLGLLIAAGGSVSSNLLIPLFTGHSGSSGVGPFFLLPLLGLVGHGIVRHRLLDLRFVIHRSVAFAAVIIAIWAASWETLRHARALPPDRLSVPFGVLLLGVVAAICLSAPVAPRLARLIDRYFLRSRLAFDRALQEAARNLSRPLTLGELTARLKGVLESTLVPDRVLIFTRPSTRDRAAPPDASGGGGGPLPATGDDALGHAAWTIRSTVPAVRLLGAVPGAGDDPAGPENVLRASGDEVWIGLGRDLRHHGVVLLGPRASGEPYFAPAVRFLEDLAEVASMAFDIAAYVTERERAEAMLSSELEVLQMIATGASLPSVLDTLCLGVERQLEGVVCAVMLLDPDGARLRRGAAPSLSDEYVRAIDGLAIGALAACCGTAAYLKQPVMVADIARDARWDAYGELAVAHGLRACWSTPVLAADGTVLGTFAMYFRERGTPDQAERRVFERATHIARMAIERVRAEEALRQTEDQLRHAQRIEALGQLAGGVAHDFNNLLTVISGRAEIAQRKVDPGGPIQKDIDLIHKTAERAAALTGQLLAFSRKQLLQPRILDPALIVGGMAPMLHRLIGEDIDLRIDLGAALGYIRADQAQIEQVILNLVVNARDAMPDGGELRLSVDRIELDEAFGRRHPGARHGRHVRITVTDTGSGMSADTRSHLFEPFFTTKERGKGTGLGLSTVYGIVRQHGGYIVAESEPGQGSTFTIYLPSTEGAPDENRTEAGRPRERGGSETILLVEDEEDVRGLARDVLENVGYRVLEAASGAEALRMAAEYPDAIHALVSDVVMPEMGGAELAQRLVATRPEVKVLYMSGYTGDALSKHGILDRAANLLQKPFATDALVHRVRDVLEAPQGTRA